MKTQTLCWKQRSKNNCNSKMKKNNFQIAFVLLQLFSVFINFMVIDNPSLCSVKRRNDKYTVDYLVIIFEACIVCYLLPATALGCTKEIKYFCHWLFSLTFWAETTKMSCCCEITSSDRHTVYPVTLKNKRI